MINPTKLAIAELGSQSNLAKACGVSQNAVHKWANGGRVSLEKALVIEKVTNGKVKAEDFNPAYAELLARN